jgi:DNA primase
MSVTDDIKARVDILELVQSYNVALKKAGRLWKACCPFHAERTPSFVVYPESGTWRCFGSCAEGGDIFSFVMKHDNVDFKGALEILAQRVGIELKPQSSAQKEQEARLEKLRSLLSEAAEFFHKMLHESDGATFARAYVASRGLQEPAINQFLIGYAPLDWHAALAHLQQIGYTEDEIIEVGVAIRNENGKVYDRFRNRLMIPIRDPRGQVIGFGARALDPKDNPKYLNSPQTPLFDKGHTLFAFDAARRAIRETETAVIVEGYMDALQAHQAGFANVVAQMGTALTDVQLRILVKYAKKLVIALDPDEAGVNATMRSLAVARSTLGEARAEFDVKGVLRQATRLDLDIRIMTLPDGQDPDDLLRDTPDRWEALVNSAQPVIDYVIDRGTARVTPQMSMPDREAIAREILPILLENDAHRHYSVQKLALRLRINERDLLGLAQAQEALNRPIPASSKQQAKYAKTAAAVSALPVTAPPPSASAAGATAARQPAPGLAPTSIDLEGYCLAALIEDPSLWSLANRKLAELSKHRDGLLGPLSMEDFERSEYRAILITFQKGFEQFDVEPIEYLYHHLPQELIEELERLLKGHIASLFERGGWAGAEITSITRDQQRFQRITAPKSAEFIEKVLLLRQRRIKRMSIELGFLQQDMTQGGDAAMQSDTGPGGAPEEATDRDSAAVALLRQVHLHRVVTGQIERAIREMRQAQR